MKNNVLLLLLLLVTLSVSAQDTTFLDQQFKKVNSIEQATYYRTLQYDQPDTNRVTYTLYFKSGQIKTLKQFSNYTNYILDGKRKEWFENGQLGKDIDYKDGKLHGQLLTFWENGTPKRIDTYENGSLINGRCMKSDGMETLHFEFEKGAEFPGGMTALMNYLSNEITYPKKSRKKGIEGRVVISFYVNIDGTISDITLLQTVDNELDQEALRVIKAMPNWQPAMEDGELTPSKFKIPVLFKLT